MPGTSPSGQPEALLLNALNELKRKVADLERAQRLAYSPPRFTKAEREALSPSVPTLIIVPEEASGSRVQCWDGTKWAILG